MKVWQCYDNHPPQQFKYENERIIHIPTGFCVDVKDGDRQQLQLWKCFDGNTNQRWIENAPKPLPPPSTNAEVPTPSASA